MQHEGLVKMYEVTVIDGAREVVLPSLRTRLEVDGLLRRGRTLRVRQAERVVLPPSLAGRRGP